MSAMTTAASTAVVLGIDFGTLSGRALVVRVSDGAELGSAVREYRHGVLDRALPGNGPTLPPAWALQVPVDYREVLRTAVPQALAAAGVDPTLVIGVGTDFTACTMLPVTRDGTPLCELPEFADRPHAYVKLWKHHAAQPQADRINRLAAERAEPWLRRYGGLISAEWEFAKALQVLEDDPEIFATMRYWVEAADWIVWQLTGRYVRNACTAGYKGMLQDGHYPSRDFLGALNPAFAGVVDEKLDAPIGRLGDAAGALSADGAALTGLPAGIPVAVGNVDAHVAAAAGNALRSGQMVAIMGTSTCHVINADVLREVPGMCGVVDAGIVDEKWGYEAGQSGAGDIFDWYLKSAIPAEYSARAANAGQSLHELLTTLATGQTIGQHGLIALDWLSGNRSVLVNHDLSGVLVGLTMRTRPEDVYRALIEATAFGTRVIIEAFVSTGIPVDELVMTGGLVKNPLLMQIYADVTRLPLGLITSAHGSALGSAIHAAAAAGAYPGVAAAAAAMGSVRRAVYRPIEANAAACDELFSAYVELHDHFGRGGSDVMHRLKALQRRAFAAAAATSSSPDGGRTAQNCP